MGFVYVEYGVRQGGVLSSVLFSIYIDGLICQLSVSEYDVYMQFVYISVLFYRDDMAFLSGTRVVACII